MKKELLLMITAGSMLLAGCGGQTVVSDAPDPGTESAVSEPAGEPAAEEKELVYKPFVIGTEAGGEYNPFFSAGECPELISELLNVKLLENDRTGRIIYKGIEGETINYNGTDYSYSGIADCDVKTEEDGSVVYSFRLRDDVCFSDGEKLTADDLIFTYYVLCDPSYDGDAELGSLPIRGLEAYRGKSRPLLDIMVEKGEANTDFELYSEEEQKEFFEKDLPAAGAEFAQSIADHCIEAGYVTGIEKIDNNTIANAMANWGYAAVNDDESITAYNSRTHWTLDGSDGPEAADFFNEMMLKHKGNIRKLSDAEKAGAALTDFLPDKYGNTIETEEPVMNIEGIVRKSDTEVTVTLDTATASDIYRLNCYVLPLHVYGDAASFDPASGKFGFTKGDLSSARNAESFIGAGPYILESFEEGVYSFKANENYYKGKPVTEEIKVCAVPEDGAVAAIADGRIDAACCEPSNAVMDELRKANGGDIESASKIKAVMRDAGSYGYIGMNIQRVKVGNDPLSAESVYLRKALATVFAVYRDDAVRAYYGDTARVTDYPVSDINILKDREDASYKAYSKDNTGRELFSENMNEDNRTEAALNAALTYFKLAGYTVDDGKVTAAPEGAALKLEAMISGGGEGDHPSMYILTKASEALKKIGFELTVTDLDDAYQLWTKTEGGQADIWCAAWPSEIWPDMFDIYHSEGRNAFMYRIYDKELDALINEATAETDPDKQSEAYMKCLDHITGLTVELPVYRRQGCLLFSVEKVEISDLPAEMTPYYDYLNQIETLKIKPSAL